MTKNELNDILRLDRLIQSNLKQLDELKMYRGGLPTMETNVRVQSGGDTSVVENLVIKMVGLDEKITRDIDRLVDMKAEARDLFEDLNYDLRLKLVMQLRYLECLEWRDVASRAGYSHKHVFKLHGMAINQLFPKVDTK